MSTYLDYNATAPTRLEVTARMAELQAEPLNPSSVHANGRKAKQLLTQARAEIAATLSVWPREAIFTGSGTEANNTVLRQFSPHEIAVSAIEHSSILNTLNVPSPFQGEDRVRVGSSTASISMEERTLTPALSLEGRGGHIIPVDANGVLDLQALEALLQANPHIRLVSVMLANNETGVIQPISAIAAIVHRYNAYLHTDAVQALGKIPVDMGLMGADMLTISAHKCGGPLGAAALVVRDSIPFAPLLKGGRQEEGRRAGTENVAAIAGFALALQLAQTREPMQHLRGWLDAMEAELRAFAPDMIIWGQGAPRLPNTSCLSMPGVENEVQLMHMDLNGIMVSAGSACSSGRIEPSHVLLAMGASDADARAASRVSGGWNTQEADILRFTEAWKQLYKRLKHKEK